MGCLGCLWGAGARAACEAAAQRHVPRSSAPSSSQQQQHQQQQRMMWEEQQKWKVWEQHRVQRKQQADKICNEARQARLLACGIDPSISPPETPVGFVTLHTKHGSRLERKLEYNVRSRRSASGAAPRESEWCYS